jgi:hypothetical protein
MTIGEGTLDLDGKGPEPTLGVAGHGGEARGRARIRRLASASVASWLRMGLGLRSVTVVPTPRIIP